MAEGLIGALVTKEQKEKLLAERQLDFAYSYEDKARFRVNAYYQKGRMAAALRAIPSSVPSAEQPVRSTSMGCVLAGTHSRMSWTAAGRPRSASSVCARMRSSSVPGLSRTTCT